MAKESTMNTLLAVLEESSSMPYTERLKKYRQLQTLIEKNENITSLKRLTIQLIKELKNDFNRFSMPVINIILKILMNNKIESLQMLSHDLEIIAVLGLKSISANKGKNDLHQWLKLLNECPDNVLLVVAKEHKQDLFSLFQQCSDNADIQVEYFKLLIKFLEVLPSDIKSKYVEHGISLWFSKVIPYILTAMTDVKQSNNMHITLLEMLTIELVKTNYIHNKEWMQFLADLGTPTKYPEMMITTLTNKSAIWHKVWCAIIKLLNKELTINKYNKNAAILNKMLSVVERAFKMEPIDRCRAFQCWKVFIDNCPKDNNGFTPKQMKLFMVPLQANNARVENVVHAKFDTWWHLINKCRNKILDYKDILLLPFLYYSFGRYNQVGSSYVLQNFPTVQIQAAYALIDICGDQCKGCLPEEFSKLGSPILTSKMLLESTGDWMHSLKCATKYLAKLSLDQDLQRKQITCLWSSFATHISPISDISKKKECRDNLIRILSHLLQDSKNFDNMNKIVFNTVLDVFINNKRPWLECEKKEDFDTDGWCKLMKLLLDPECYECYSSCNDISGVSLFGSILTKFFEHVPYNGGHYINWVLEQLVPHDKSLVVWTALAQTIYKSETLIGAQSYYTKILTWPIKALDKLSDGIIPAEVWNALYATIREKLPKTSSVDIDILRNISHHKKHPIFTTYVLLSTLKFAIPSQKISFAEYMQLLAENLKTFIDKEIDNKIGSSIVLLVDILTLIAENMFNVVDFSTAEFTVKVAISTLKIIVKTHDVSTDVSSLIDKVLNILLSIYNSKHYALTGLRIDIVESVIAFTRHPHTFVKDRSLFLLKQMFENTKSQDFCVYSLLKTTLHGDTIANPVTPISSKKDLQSKKKADTPIVKKVLEDGEEFLVVKSNWKFNPKKLTERQKEKFLRKSEDIPALYQNLSQSQDEFKQLQSQGSSSSTIVRSETQDDISFIQSSQNRDIVPHIIDGILKNDNKSDNNKNASSKPMESSEVNTVNNTKVTDNVNKSPRVSIRDRVFQSVEKLSGNVANTSINKSPNADKIFVHKPSREKRKPKRFDDFESGIPKRSIASTIVNCISTKDANENFGEQFKTPEINKLENVPVSIDLTNGENDDIELNKNENTNKSDGIETIISNSATTQCTTESINTQPETTPINRRKRKSKIEKELAIDMVEGNPFLLSTGIRNRRSRKSGLNDAQSTSKLNEMSSKSDDTLPPDNLRKSIDSPDEEVKKMPMSEDFIESSQDSSISTVSIKPNRLSLKKNGRGGNNNSDDILTVTPTNLMDTIVIQDDFKEPSFIRDSAGTFVEIDTENADTQPVIKSTASSQIANDNSCVTGNAENNSVLNSDNAENHSVLNSNNAENHSVLNSDNMESQPVLSSINTGNNSVLNSDKTADADTIIVDADTLLIDKPDTKIGNDNPNESEITKEKSYDTSSSGISSPFKDEDERHNDFLNNTLDISPIKVTSPERENNKTPSPEKPEEFVVIKLTSPVHDDGEPAENSPEMFTGENITQDKSEISPQRENINIANISSPNSSTLQKNNRFQIRSGGRAAQMLSMCQADLVSSNNSAKRIIRTPGNNGNSENGEKFVDDVQFLDFKRQLNGLNCSPSVPILKRKLADIADDTPVSPASKRKRVSFHDPPVSTTMAVTKYIEPNEGKSPPSSYIKRQERSPRQFLKSPKKLEMQFQFDSTSSQKVIEPNVSCSDDVVMTCSEQMTPAVEVVNNCDLNDVDPICPELMDCSKSIGDIASELSSTTMKELLVKQLEGTVDTIGDLASMTELNINRLCIKAPKVVVARKVLTDYMSKIVKSDGEPIRKNADLVVTKVDMEVQTTLSEFKDNEVQTFGVSVTDSCIQTDKQSGPDMLKEIDDSLIIAHLKTRLHNNPELRVQMYDALRQTHTESASQSLSNYLHEHFDPIDLIVVCNSISERASKEMKEHFIIHKKAKDQNS